MIGLTRHRWLHELVAKSHTYDIANTLLRRFPVERRLPPSGFVYRLTSVDHFSIAAGLFVGNEYGPAVGSSPVATLVDVGCNAGWFTLWLLARSLKRPRFGLLIDAHPRMATEAKWHMARNGLRNFHVVCGAVGIRHGEQFTNFYLNPSTSASSVLEFQTGMQLPSKGRISRIVVPAVNVGAEWRARFGSVDIDLMKVDVEGKELDFMINEQPFLARYVHKLVIEWHKWSVALGDLDSQLQPMGFVRSGIFGETESVGLAAYENLHKLR